jgi:hypothetical protein
MEQKINDLILKNKRVLDYTDETKIIITDNIYGNIEISNDTENILVKFNKCLTNYRDSDISDECCICYESCNNILHCNHYICIECRDIMNSIHKELICPLCRQTEQYNIGYIFTLPIKAVRKLIV